MRINEIKRFIEESWSKETCYPTLQDTWTKENPSLGQCAITSLVVNDFLGGKIMRCMCGDISHYYSVINNELIDLAVGQFKDVPPDYEHGEPRTREYLLSNEDTKNRYKMLLNNVRENFIKYGEKDYTLLDKNEEPYISKFPGLISGNQKIKIYGKIDCRSTLGWVKRGGQVLETIYFENQETAKEAGYRPCKECLLDEYIEWQNMLKILNKKK